MFVSIVSPLNGIHHDRPNATSEFIDGPFAIGMQAVAEKDHEQIQFGMTQKVVPVNPPCPNARSENPSPLLDE